MFKLINLLIGYGVISKRGYIKQKAKNSKRDLMFLSKLVVEICTVLFCLIVGIFKTIKWCFKKVIPLKDKKIENIIDMSNVISLDEYRDKKRKIS